MMLACIIILLAIWWPELVALLAVLVLIAWTGHSEAADFWLSTPTEAAMEQGLTKFSQYGGVSDFSSKDFNDADHGGLLKPDFFYGGTLADGGTWYLEVRGQIVSPTPSVAPQAPNLGNFTNRVGQTVEPEVQFTHDRKVGVDVPVYGPTAFWVLVHWNSRLPLPNYAGQGITVSTTGPYKQNY